MEIPFLLSHATSEGRSYGMPISKLRECPENAASIEIDVMHTLPSFYSPVTDAKIP
jgi:hypothetical protein